VLGLAEIGEAFFRLFLGIFVKWIDWGEVLDRLTEISDRI
jgi:hypothetical protein